MMMVRMGFVETESCAKRRRFGERCEYEDETDVAALVENEIISFKFLTALHISKAEVEGCCHNLLTIYNWNIVFVFRKI